MDYRNEPEKARQTINDNIARATHGRINNLLPGGSIDTSTRLVLTNAVYFKAKWLHQFVESDTKQETFNSSTGPRKTKIMHAVEKNTSVCIADDYAVYDLEFDSARNKNDYKGAYILRVILPTIDNEHPMNKRMEQLSKVEEQLTADFMKECQYQYFNKVYVAMPKFKLAPPTKNINDILETLGMKKAFSGRADFYAMANSTPKPDDLSPYLMISVVYHKAFIEIDEQGGEAAAATAVAMEPTRSGSLKKRPTKEYYFTVDHPFIYMIVEKSTQAAVFMGRVTDL